MAAAFKEASKTAIASLPLNPAEVIKNKASAASFAPRPVLLAISMAFSPILSTSSPAIPTNDFIWVIDLLKVFALLKA